ncbi:MAG TPA: hypothetical protein VH518_10340 [Tepidisphaeraceae bacterium]
MPLQLRFCPRSVFVIAVSLLLAATLSGCAGGSGTKGKPAGDDRGQLSIGTKMTHDRLDQLTQSFADRYVVLISTACDRVRSGNPSPTQRREAQILKINCATGAYDIATEVDPFTRLLDLVVVATLESQVWIDDGKARDTFGDRAEPVIKAMRRGRVEALDMAAMVFTSIQLDQLDYLIWDYRKKNPDVERVAWARFADFSDSRGKSAVAEAQSTGIFAEVSAATRELDQTRLLMERVFYLLKREPLLLRWQAEGFKDDVVATPEVEKVMQSIDRITLQAEQMPQHVAAERKAMLDAFDERRSAVDQSVKGIRDMFIESRQTFTTMTETAKSIDQFLKSTDAIMARSEEADKNRPTTQESRPFDIREYTTAAQELSITVAHLNELIRSSNDLLGSPEWDRRIEGINKAADGRVRLAAERSRDLVDTIFKRVYIAMGVLFAVLVVYRLVASMLLRRIHDARGGHN